MAAGHVPGSLSSPSTSRTPCSRHDVYLDLRHTGDYAFSDLYLFVTVTGPGLPAVRDTVECPLADPIGPLVRQGPRFHQERARAVQAQQTIPARSGRYSIKLEQAMRMDPLEGVIDVGISVEKSGQGEPEQRLAAG